jgi:signal peptidase I
MNWIRFSSFFSALLLLAVLAAWIFFLPLQFGGLTAYVIIDGKSMEPVYHMGDLVITRRETAYAVGDIVTYFNRDLKRNVIHRIVAIQAGAFTFKGDNNSWLDNDHPPFQNMVGKAWLHLPGVGIWLTRLQTPLGIAVLSVVIILIVLGLFLAGSRRLRARRKKLLSGLHPISFSTTFNPGDAVMRSVGRQLETLIFVLVILLGVSLFLGYSAFTKPESLTGPLTSEYVQVGRFIYQATAQDGVYDAGGPQTGDPIFLRTTCQVQVRFSYSLAGTGLTDPTGTFALRVESHDINGWVRSFPLIPVTAFAGSNALLQADFNPCEILASLRAAELKTGLSRPSYTLYLIPEIHFTSQSVSGPVAGSFQPRLVFYLDDYQMYVTREAPEVDPYAPYQVEKFSLLLDQPNLLQLPFVSIPVRLARILALVGLALSLGLGLFVTVRVLQEIQTDPSIGISLRYGTLIVDVNQISFDIRSRLIKVDAFEDIVKLAERNSTAIMHLHREKEHEFLVEGNSVVYSYRVPHRR